jgi:uncharacterized protein YbaR (Trm112 family)
MTTVNNQSTANEAVLCPDCKGKGWELVGEDDQGESEHDPCPLCRGKGRLYCETVKGWVRDPRGQFLFTRFCDAPAAALVYDCGGDQAPLVLCRDCAGDVSPAAGYACTTRPDGLTAAVWRPAMAPACSEAA